MYGRASAVNPQQVGAKAAAHYTLDIAAGASATIQVRVTDSASSSGVDGREFDEVFAQRLPELTSSIDCDPAGVCGYRLCGRTSLLLAFSCSFC